MNGPSRTERAYAAEETVPRGRVFPSVADAQRYADTVTASSWWSGRFPHVVRIEVVAIRSAAIDAAGTCESGRRAGVIGLTPRGRTEITVLHEIAHAVDASGDGHGPAWAATFLELVYRMRGTGPWMELRAAFDSHGVVTESSG